MHSTPPISLTNGLNHRQKDLLFLIAIFFLYMLVYGISCFQHALSGDELKEMMEDVPDIYIAQRRWGTALWKELFGYGYLPYLHVILFSLFAAVTILLHTKIFNLQQLPEKLSYATIYAICPVWPGLIRFSELSDCFSLSMLLASLAIYYISKGKEFRNNIIAVLLVLFSLSMYQVNLFYLGTLWLAWYIFRIINNTPISFIREGVRSLLIVICGGFLYMFIGNILRNSGLAAQEVIDMVDTYQGHFSEKWTKVFQSGSPVFILTVIVHYCLESIPYLTGIQKLAGGNNIYTQLYLFFGCCCFALTAIQTWFAHPARRAFAVILTAGAILLFPITAYVASAGTMNQLRMFQALGISTATLGTIVVKLNLDRRFILRLISIFLIFMVTKATYSNALSQRNAAWNFERTKLQFFEIKLFSKKIAEQNQLQNYKIYLCGDWWPIKSLPLTKALDYKESPFLTGCVQPFTVKHFAAYFGSGDMERLEMKDTPDELKQLLQNRPVYPNPNCAFVHNGNIFIKVYEDPNN